MPANTRGDVEARVGTFVSALNLTIGAAATQIFTARLQEAETGGDSSGVELFFGAVGADGEGIGGRNILDGI